MQINQTNAFNKLENQKLQRNYNEPKKYCYDMQNQIESRELHIM